MGILKKMFYDCFDREINSYDIPEECYGKLVLLGNILAVANEIFHFTKGVFLSDICYKQMFILLIFSGMSLWFLKRRNYKLSAVVLVSGVLAALLTCLANEKFTSLFWLPLVPIAAGILLGESGLIFFTALTVTLASAVYVIEVYLGKMSVTSYVFEVNLLSVASDAFAAFLTFVFVIYIYRVFLDIYREKLKMLLEFDYLTKALSRRSLFARLNNGELGRYALIMFDIDHFKEINDTFGHETGDRILKKLVQVIKSNLRRSDFIGRFGGEEFIIVLPGATKHEATIVAEKLRKIVEETDFGIGRPVTISLGTVESTEAENLEQLLSMVDKRLYRAKREGRNRTVSEDGNEGSGNQRLAQDRFNTHLA